ncbi:MAG TPA: DUF2807 domain-containing protein [Myxococcaceae bacterium]
MKSKLVLAVALAAILVGCDGGCGEIPGNGVIVEQSRDTAPFTGVVSSLGIQAEVLVGPEQSVKLRGDENLLDLISLSVGTDGVLTAWWAASAPPVETQPFVLTLTTPTLRTAGAEGRSRLVARGIQADEFSVSASDRSEVVLEGTAQGLTLEAWGGGRVLARELPVGAAVVTMREGGLATLHVTQQLTGSVVDGSSLTVHGQPPQVNLIDSEDSEVLFE